MIRPYPEAETPLLSAIAGKNGGNKQTVNADENVETIVIQKINTCLNKNQELKIKWLPNNQKSYFKKS